MKGNCFACHLPKVMPMAGTFMGFPSPFSRESFPHVSLFLSLFVLNLIRFIDWCLPAEVFTVLFLLETTATYFKTNFTLSFFEYDHTSLATFY